MRRTSLVFACASVISLALAPFSVAQPRPEDESRIRSYIAGSWDSLSRSMSECKSLVDPKVTTAPVLYLPAGMAVPAAVQAAQKGYNVVNGNENFKVAAGYKSNVVGFGWTNGVYVRMADLLGGK